MNSLPEMPLVNHLVSHGVDRKKLYIHAAHDAFVDESARSTVLHKRIVCRMIQYPQSKSMCINHLESVNFSIRQACSRMLSTRL